jgi:hypothetical protein
LAHLILRTRRLIYGSLYYKRHIQKYISDRIGFSPK